MVELLNVEGLVLEPAGALAVDALRDIAEPGKVIVAIVSGGNFDFERLPDVKERALHWQGRKKYFILRLPQRPGALREFLDVLGPDDDIARFEYLKKSARNFGSVLIGIETATRENFPVLEARMAGCRLHLRRHHRGCGDHQPADLMLNRIVHDGPADAPVLVVAHGLFGSGRNWGAVARRLAEGRRVVAVDMRNHGDSPSSLRG